MANEKKHGWNNNQKEQKEASKHGQFNHAEREEKSMKHERNESKQAQSNRGEKREAGSRREEDME